MIMTTMTTTIIIVAIIISNGINGVYTDNNYRYYFYYWGRIIRRMGTLRTFAGCSLIKEARNRGRFSMRVLREPLVMRKSEPPLLSFPRFVPTLLLSYELKSKPSFLLISVFTRADYSLSTFERSFHPFFPRTNIEDIRYGKGEE